MKNTVLSLKKESSLRKMSILCVIAIFLVFGSVSVYAQQVKTTPDKEKFDKLTPEQKEKFKEGMEKARDTALESAKSYNEACSAVTKDAVTAHDRVVKNAERVKALLEVVKAIGEADQNKLNQKEQDLRKDQILEKLKEEEKEKKDKEKQRN